MPNAPVNLLLVSLCCLLAAAAFVPNIGGRHWFYRAFEFARLQLFVIQLLGLVIWAFFCDFSSFVETTSGIVLMMAMVFQGYYFLPYLPYKSVLGTEAVSGTSFSVLVANVFMDNKNFDQFLQNVRECEPDLLLTLESNHAWQKALDTLELYPYTVKVPYENTYGMHLYSKFRITKHAVHHLVDDDCPCIEAEVDVRGTSMMVFGFHPKPPSPTEEPNSVERDLEFRKLGELLQQSKGSQLVLGDFNAVTWSKPTQKLIRSTRLKDARKGRGFHSTFHADYFFLRFPIDQLLHSHDLKTIEVKVLPHIGSDHFPLYGRLQLPES